nr:hypothetical protein BJQ95_01428 [Cryobacterium sp. SO1]
MPFQKESVPTAPGIRSEPSKRKTVFSSCRISTLCFRMSLDASEASRPVLALMTPPSSTRLFAQVSLER